MAAPYTEDWPSLSKINPELEALLPSLGGFQMFTPETTVESLRGMGAGRPPSEKWPEVRERDIQIPVRDGSSNRARVYEPAAETKSAKPLLVFAFGGGYIIGSIESEEYNCRTWVKKLGGVAVSISYRLAPEHAWPGPHEDMYDAVKWVAANYKDLGADASQAFVLGGTSASATTMATISHLWRDEGLSPPLTGLFLSVPAVCIVSALPKKYKALEVAWEQNKDAPIYTQTISNFIFDIVKPDPYDPLRSPLLFSTGHRNLPPTYFIVAGADIWRDVGLLYEKILREECGLKTKIDVFPGLPHGFWSFFPQAGFAQEFREKSEEGLGWLVEQRGKVV